MVGGVSDIKLKRNNSLLAAPGLLVLGEHVVGVLGEHVLGVLGVQCSLYLLWVCLVGSVVSSRTNHRPHQFLLR